jgi:hypothetical protein
MPVAFYKTHLEEVKHVISYYDGTTFYRYTFQLPVFGAVTFTLDLF